MIPTPEAIAELKEIYRKKNGKELSNAEASDMGYRLYGLVELTMKVVKRDIHRKQRLKKEPDGFLLPDEGYTCSICHSSSGKKWYHWYGITCTLCRKAITEDTVPVFTAKHRNSWYAMWELESKFHIKGPTARKLVRQGELVARIVLGENEKPYEYIFLKKENPKLTDPERDSPARKSYDRNQDKVSAVRIRESISRKSVNFAKQRDRTTKPLSGAESL